MNDAEPTRVLLVEDQQLIRRGLAMLLSTVDGIDVTAQAEDGHAALDILATTEVDVVLVDARMPGIRASTRTTSSSVVAKISSAACPSSA